jgi:hypothetical protein
MPRTSKIGEFIFSKPLTRQQTDRGAEEGADCQGVSLLPTRSGSDSVAAGAGSRTSEVLHVLRLKDSEDYESDEARSLHMNYEYFPVGGWYPDRDLFRQTGLFGSRELNFPLDTYEIFSFCDEARCYAVGAQTNIADVFDHSEEVNLAEAPHEFGTLHKGHSAQFRSTNMKRASFWKQLLITTEIRQP